MQTITKVANWLSPESDIYRATVADPDVPWWQYRRRAAQDGLQKAARRTGLWVGGRVTVDAEAVSFGPNAVNEAVHRIPTHWRVPFGAIQRVTVRFGLVSRIIDLHTDRGVVTFRCYGARALAQEIAARTGAPLG